MSWAPLLAEDDILVSFCMRNTQKFKSTTIGKCLSGTQAQVTLSTALFLPWYLRLCIYVHTPNTL